MQFDGYRVRRPPTGGTDIPADTDMPLFPDSTADDSADPHPHPVTAA
jgi:hypothetical protein